MILKLEEKNNNFKMAVETELTIHIVLPIIVGFIIGIVEAYFVYEDENMTSGQQFIGDMWHGLLFSVFGVLAATNVPWLLTMGVFDNLGFVKNLLMIDINGNSLIVSIFITLFMMIKMVASHAIKGVSGSGFSEKWWHKILVSSAIGFASYYMVYIYAMPFVQGLAEAIPFLPF
jgi:hypothetical protein